MSSKPITPPHSNGMPDAESAALLDDSKRLTPTVPTDVSGLADSNEVSCEIIFRGRRAALLYNKATQCIVIRKLAKRASQYSSQQRQSKNASSGEQPNSSTTSNGGGRKEQQIKGTVVLVLPISYVVNIETEHERSVRQISRASRDTEHLKEDDDAETLILCKLGGFREGSEDQSIFYHSRSTTFGAGRSDFCLERAAAAAQNEGVVPDDEDAPVPRDYIPLRTASNQQQHMRVHSNVHNQSRSSDTETPGPTSLRPAAQTKFFLHYVNPKTNDKHTIRTVVFSSVDQYIGGSPLAIATSTILSEVYRQGLKTIIVFISPVSGSGKGKEMYEKQIAPILHFSRHRLQTILTTRQNFCEDYVADLKHNVSERHIVAVVGGDGMMHELVNGLYRRKLAIQELLRRRRAMSTATDGEAANTAPKREGGGDAADPRVLNKPENATRTASSGEALVGFGAFTSVGGVVPAAKEEEAILNIMPSVATIAAGSACGLAKSLDVLSSARGALALVHNEVVVGDLMKMDFIDNPTLKKNMEIKLGKEKMRSAKQKFIQDRGRPVGSGKKGATSNTGSSAVVNSGGVAFTDPLSYAVGAPAYHSCVSFMSVSFGVPNEIDRGSEKLRWMGNNRFAAYAVFLILKGLPLYRMRMRYIPWESEHTVPVSKRATTDVLPGESEFPRCTMRSNCEHCRLHRVHGGGTDASSGSNFREESESINFDDPTLPWVTINSKYFSIMVTNLRDAAQDMIMSPLQHMSDGAMDIVYSESLPNMNARTEFVKYFLALEKGEHIHSDIVRYVKARAVEIIPDDGIVMSDGEMMPLASVRITKLHTAVKYVRGR